MQNGYFRFLKQNQFFPKLELTVLVCANKKNGSRFVFARFLKYPGCFNIYKQIEVQNFVRIASEGVDDQMDTIEIDPSLVTFF